VGPQRNRNEMRRAAFDSFARTTPPGYPPGGASAQPQ
jgi:hypothetical protein